LDLLMLSDYLGDDCIEICTRSTPNMGRTSQYDTLLPFLH
jgi:hypothetical protein